MKSLLPWLIPLSEDDFSQLWDNATFIFDTNCLLNLYRMSRPTAEDFLKVLYELRERIWLPHQVVQEFLENREGVIDAESSSFKKALKEIKEWKEEQKNFNKLKGRLKQTGRIVAAELDEVFDGQEQYFNAINEVEDKLRQKVEEVAKIHSSLNPDDDHILERLIMLFDPEHNLEVAQLKPKMGQPYNDLQLKAIYDEGEERYKKSKPPGFEDAKGKDDERKYGDLVLWKQILQHAKEASKPVVFITGDMKEDWWGKRNTHKVSSPHSELRREFYEEIKQPFWMYTTQHFLEEAKKRLEINIDSRSIEEADEVANLVANDPALSVSSSKAFPEQSVTLPKTPTSGEIRKVVTQYKKLAAFLAQQKASSISLNSQLNRLKKQDFVRRIKSLQPFLEIEENRILLEGLGVDPELINLLRLTSSDDEISSNIEELNNIFDLIQRSGLTQRDGSEQEFNEEGLSDTDNSGS